MNVELRHLIATTEELRDEMASLTRSNSDLSLDVQRLARDFPEEQARRRRHTVIIWGAIVAGFVGVLVALVSLTSVVHSNQNFTRQQQELAEARAQARVEVSCRASNEFRSNFYRGVRAYVEALLMDDLVDPETQARLDAAETALRDAVPLREDCLAYD